MDIPSKGNIFLQNYVFFVIQNKIIQALCNCKMHYIYSFVTK